MKSPHDCATLAEVRAEIDRLDHTVVEAIGQRKEYVHAAVRFKGSESDVQAPDRQRKMLAARRFWAEEKGVDPDLVESLFRQIVAHFVSLELTAFSGSDAAKAGSPQLPPTQKAAGGERRDTADA